MGKVIWIVIFLFFLSCNTDTKYKYHFKGEVVVNNEIRKAEWYCDTIFLKNDTAFYYNSDCSKVTIVPPYQVFIINE